MTKIRIMVHNAIKSKLIRWLTKLDNDETQDNLKVVKDSNGIGLGWWPDIAFRQNHELQEIDGC